MHPRKYQTSGFLIKYGITENNWKSLCHSWITRELRVILTHITLSLELHKLPLLYCYTTVWLWINKVQTLSNLAFHLELNAFSV